MKILVLSDLHLEFTDFSLPRDDDNYDVVVLAGDISVGSNGISWARMMWPKKPIIYVAGNHEFYKRDRPATLHSLQATAEEFDVHFLENEVAIIDDVRFLGSTLWTDFRLFGDERTKDCLRVANQGLNDFRLITEGSKPFTAEDSSHLHELSKIWLTEKLIDTSYNGKTVVVTHHSPSWSSVAERYRKDLLSAGFSSNREDLMGFAQLWIHGHTHDSFDYKIFGTRVVCNPRGYVIRLPENVHFDPTKVIEI